ncbi:MAG: hypothetical protein KDD84_00920 [Caldilineaceae bacterium]|nr:hypothetical protein [Caldilineaceae bacterium]
MKRQLLLVTAVLVGALCMAAVLLKAPQLWAATAAQSAVPGTVSYQGYMTDASGVPYSGTVAIEAKIYDADTGGVLYWQEVQSGVVVDNGYFAMSLGAVTPLSASIFGGAPRYLEIGVNTDNVGSGPFTTLPRQKFESVPYAHWATYAVTGTHALTATYAVDAKAAISSTYATTATYAMTSGYAMTATDAVSATNAVTASYAMTAGYAVNAPWSGLSDVPAGFADGSDDGSSYKYVVVVAKEGGHYTSVVAALNSITPTASSPYLVWVAPGTYTETALVEVKGYVHLQGAGPNVTKITSTRSSTVQNTDSSTVRLYDQGRISDLYIGNSGTSSTYGIGVWMADDVTRDTVIDNTHIEVNGSGGTGHYAVYASDAEPTIKRSHLHARGASLVNAAYGSVNSAGGGFPQALIEDSVLLGAEDSLINCTDNTGTGYAMQMIESSPIVRDSYLCGGYRAIFSGINGNPIFHGSIARVSSTFGSYLVESTASGIVSFGTSQLSYFASAQTGLHTGAGNAPRCAQSYDFGTFTELGTNCQ